MKRSYDNIPINFINSPTDSLPKTRITNNNDFIYPTECNLSLPSFDLNYEESLKLQKKLREIKRIAPIDILKQKIQLKATIPKQKRRLVIDEAVKRFDLFNTKPSQNQIAEKRKSLSLQYLFQGIPLANEDNEIKKKIQYKYSPISTKKLFAPCLSNKFEPEQKPSYQTTFIGQQGDLFKLTKSPHNPARLFTAKPENSKRNPIKISFSNLSNDNKTQEKTGLLFVNMNNNKKDSANNSIIKDSLDDNYCIKSPFTLSRLSTAKPTHKKGNSLASILLPYTAINSNDTTIDKKAPNDNIKDSILSKKILPSSYSLDKIAQISQGNTGLIKEKSMNENHIENNNNNLFNEKKNLLIRTNVIPKPAKRFSILRINNNNINNNNDGNDSIELTNEKVGSTGPPKNPLYNPIIFEIPQKVKSNRDKDKNTNYDTKYYNIRIKLLHCLNYLRLLKLSIDEVLENPHIFSQKPFEKPGSFELIQACKKGDEKQVKNLLISHGKYLVYDFDNLFQTPLHAACKKGSLDIVKILIDNGADLNAADLVGRTPLYFALKNQKLDVVKHLLYSRCDPWCLDYKELCKNNSSIVSIMKKARQLHIIMMMKGPIDREAYWKSEREFILHDSIKIF